MEREVASLPRPLALQELGQHIYVSTHLVGGAEVGTLGIHGVIMMES